MSLEELESENDLFKSDSDGSCDAAFSEHIMDPEDFEVAEEVGETLRVAEEVDDLFPNPPDDEPYHPDEGPLVPEDEEAIVEVEVGDEVDPMVEEHV